MCYKCPYCEKEYDNKYKFGGHKIRCKLNPKNKVILENWKESFHKNIEKHKKSKYNNEILYCQYCGKEYKGKNSLRNHEIRCKNNPNKILSGFDIYNEKRNELNIKGENHYTKAERLGLEKPIVSKESHEIRSKVQIGKHHSKETKNKISKSYKEFLNNHPEKVGFVINHSSKQSYPEKYFEELFSKEHIDLKYHKQVKRYQLDFYNDKLKKYVEIDGNQHYSEYMIKHDNERTEFLENLGWQGFRIKWSDYLKLDENGKHNIINKIKDFLDDHKNN